MEWDDEVQSLMNRVLEHFGKDVFSRAMERALTQTLRRKDDDGLIPAGVLEDALRIELLRVARPH